MSKFCADLLKQPLKICVLADARCIFWFVSQPTIIQLIGHVRSSLLNLLHHFYDDLVNFLMQVGEPIKKT